MIKNLFILTIISLFACTDAKKPVENTSMDVGRNFIRATLDGNFTDAEMLLLKDSVNEQMFESYKKYYSSLTNDIKNGYKKASYNINSFDDAKNDSTAFINYSNSYMHKPMNIKVVKKDKQWQIDFKYTSTDTSASK